MTAEFKPRDYQRAIIEHIAAHPRSNIWAGMGTGKTVSTLTALQGLALVEDDVFPALVLAPLRVAASTWPGCVWLLRSARLTRASAASSRAPTS